MAMDFASILSAEYADKMKAAATLDVFDREAVGTGPFQFVSYQKDAVIRYKAIDGSGAAARRSTTWSTRSRPTPRCATPSSRPASAT
jgi:ABC-type transport system substrate-binding protein